MVHQELAFCPDLSVAENLALGGYPRRLGFIVDRAEMRRRATDLLARIGVSIDVDRPMLSLSVAQEQLVQIAAAVGTGAKILVFDEPTSSLAGAESEHLFELIGRLKQGGATSIYVSHRMPEVFRLADRISVLRDGHHVGTVERGQADEPTLIRMMIGRELTLSGEGAVSTPAQDTPVALSVHGLTSPGRFEGISFDLRTGEVLGFAGLVGAGRSETAAALFGLDHRATGQAQVAGRPLRLGDVRASMAAGLALVPEDRKRQGLVLMMGGTENYSLPNLKGFSRSGVLLRSRLRTRTAEAFARLRVKTPSVESPVEAMSGGNQQKVVIAKWLERGARVLIADEPTRGVDVGAKAAIHDLLRGLAGCGTAILLLSSELPELLALSHRIAVMREGRLVGIIPRAEATQERLLKMMSKGAG